MPRRANGGTCHRPGPLAAASASAATSTRSSRRSSSSALGGIDIVLDQLDRTLEALAHQDVELAAIVIADDDRVDGRYLEVHQGVLSLLARQAPVAGDLRLVAALLHVIVRDRAHGRPVREHLQAAAAVGARAADAPGDPRAAAAHGRDRALGGLAGQALLRRPRRRAGRGPRAPGPRGQPDPARHLPPARSRPATTPTSASGRCT